jgi:glycyl-tRNA synthetase beta chain
MPELLLEIGTEELPASFVRKAYHDLRDALVALLGELRLGYGEVQAMGTPRRLIVSIEGVEERQPDATKEQRGPALKAAFDESGEPTKALLGFCRSQGVEVSDLRRDEQYVWATKTIVGRPTAEVLAEELPKVVRSLSFEKSMRWGSTRMRFARPIRWILAAFGGELVPFEIEGVASGLGSRGHRFYAPEAFSATHLSDLLTELRARKVEPVAAHRSDAIRQGAEVVAEGIPEISSALLEENTFLAEWPTAIMGTFGEEFMDLPEPVLVTAMAKHERMFPVRNLDGSLTNRFVFVRNSGEDDSVRAGCEWVLNARFNDAKFFFEEDRKFTLSDFLDRTSGIVFQEKLGTVRVRADRLAELAEYLASATDAGDEEVAWARQAGLFAKADLATGLVSELSSLQGVIGAEYAARDGMPEAVVFALRRQYEPSKIGSISGPNERTAAILVMADALDKLAGYLGLGLEPSGSSDPYALRRAATTLIELAWSWPKPLSNYRELLAAALRRYKGLGEELDLGKALAAFRRLFAARYEALLPDVRHDILEAAILPTDVAGATDPQGVQFRVGVLQTLVQDSAFVQTATRPLNIVASARGKGIAFAEETPLEQVDPKDLASPEGEALLSALREMAPNMTPDATELMGQLRSLEAPINRFFDATMVMVDDVATRTARLNLLNACGQRFLLAGDFSRIVIAG